MTKGDLRREYRHLFIAKPDASLIEVPKLSYLAIDGSGEPAGPEFQDAIGALYGAAYTLKFLLKPEYEYPVMPLEGLWCSGSGAAFDPENKASWKWTLMILAPAFVTKEVVSQALVRLAEKRGRTPAMLRVKLRTLREGRCAQILHIGPYSAEAPTIARLHEWIEKAGLTQSGKHHEIYMSDPRRTAPERLKTIIRVPVKRMKAGARAARA